MSLEERLSRSLQNPYPFDVQVDRLGLIADGSHPYRIAGNSAYWNLIKARESADTFAASYRNFNVGVSVVAYNARSKDLAILSGANVKVDDTDLINVHAEDTAVGKAEGLDYDLISFVGVVGDVQPDQQSGQELEVLHPCGRCRNKFEQSDLINDLTLFMSANNDFTVVEMYSLEGLKRFHESGDKSGIITIETGPNFRDWDQKVTPHIAEYQAAVAEHFHAK